MTDLRYPIGQFTWAAPGSEEQSAAERRRYIDVLAKLPNKMRAAVRDLSPQQLETPYRPDGWTVRQVVHHVPESHLNAYTRFKLALTEDTPLIKPYDEDGWSKTGEVKTTPIETSLVLLEALHDRWVRLLEIVTPSEY